MVVPSLYSLILINIIVCTKSVSCATSNDWLFNIGNFILFADFAGDVLAKVLFVLLPGLLRCADDVGTAFFRQVDGKDFAFGGGVREAGFRGL